MQPAGPVWSAVALLQVRGVSRCTAVAVAPDTVVTAAHCLWNRALGRVVPPGSVHLLFGYDRGAFLRHVVPTRIGFAAGAEPGSHDVRGSDLAVLTVAMASPVVLPPMEASLPRGTPVALGGFGQDRAQRLFVDPGCRLGDGASGTDGRPLLTHDCDGTRGDSGGALVGTDAAGQPGLVGLAVAAWNDRAGGFAVSGAAVAAAIRASR